VDWRLIEKTHGYPADGQGAGPHNTHLHGDLIVQLLGADADAVAQGVIAVVGWEEHHMGVL
jgi:hypothetical protein